MAMYLDHKDDDMGFLEPHGEDPYHITPIVTKENAPPPPPAKTAPSLAAQVFISALKNYWLGGQAYD